MGKTKIWSNCVELKSVWCVDLEDSGAYYVMRFGINLYLNRRREPVKFCEVFTKGLKVLIVSDRVKFEAICWIFEIFQSSNPPNCATATVIQLPLLLKSPLRWSFFQSVSPDFQSKSNPSQLFWLTRIIPTLSLLLLPLLLTSASRLLDHRLWR